jgi:hypothetical protein
VLAVVNVGWYVTTVVPTLPEDFGLVELGTSIVLAPLYPIAWAFLAGAAFETRRRLLLLGSLVFLALQAVVVAFSLASPGPEADLDRLTLVYVIGLIFGWLLLAVSPLRLEMGTQRPLREEAP